MERAGDRWPERTPGLLILVFQYLSNEDCGLAHRGRDVDECVVHGFSVRANDRVTEEIRATKGRTYGRPAE